MKLSTLDYLSLVSPHLPPRLVSSASLDEIARLAALLPPSSNFGFECRLGSPEREADFLVAVIASDGSRAAWASQNGLSVPPGPQPPAGAWQRVGPFLADWHGGQAELAPLNDAWLEFDVGPPGSLLPEPSFFFGFDTAAGRNHPALCLALVERLYEKPLPAVRRAKLESCFAALPAGAVIFQVGAMLARPGLEVRLCLRRMTAAAIRNYLEELDWPGSPAFLAEQMAELQPLVDGALNLDISVGEQLAPAIGLECGIEDGPGGRAKAVALLAYLEAQGACLKGKGEAIFDWLGYSTEETETGRWPAHLLKGSRALGPHTVSTFARTLNHFKITCQAGQPLGAKVYLGVRHFWGQVAGASP
jgi:hypothetical protein